MTTARARLVMLALVPMLLLAFGGPVDAEEVRFVFTPQIWFSNIPSNGFAGKTNIGNSPTGVCPSSDQIFLNSLDLCGTPGTDIVSSNGKPTSLIFPQWGGQLAIQYGQYTLGIAAQFVSMEHTSRIKFSKDAHLNFPFDCGSDAACNEEGSGFFRGAPIADETVRTDRTDVDLTLTYFIPDVIKDVIDVSAGGGLKWIRASGHRTLSDIRLAGSSDDLLGFPPDYVLKNGSLRNKASFLENVYAITVPLTVNYHLNQKKTLFLPLTVTPMFGYGERTDEVTGFDNAFVKGGTGDVGLRYVFSNGVAIYAGYRGQIIQSIDRYVAHGPMINMSVPFGGK